LTSLSSHVTESRLKKRESTQMPTLTPRICHWCQMRITGRTRGTDRNGNKKADGYAGCDGDGRLLVMLRGEDGWVLKRPLGPDEGELYASDDGVQVEIGYVEGLLQLLLVDISNASFRHFGSRRCCACRSGRDDCTVVPELYLYLQVSNPKVNTLHVPLEPLSLVRWGGRQPRGME